MRIRVKRSQSPECQEPQGPLTSDLWPLTSVSADSCHAEGLHDSLEFVHVAIIDDDATAVGVCV